MGETRRGVLTKDTINEQGMILTKKHGFTVKEADGKVLSFDRLDHEEYGNTLLFGDAVFFLKFWDKEDLEKAYNLIREIVEEELTRRHMNNG